ncbi:hypothetical protein OAO87_01905, partial [bacterium]|nr:hypothetical protein [bacterium]
MSSDSSIKYQHKDATECNAFSAKLRALSRKSSAATLKAYNFSTSEEPHGLEAPALKDASADLYDIIILNTANQNLVDTLEKRYALDGVESLRYIKGCHSAGGNDGKLTAASLGYQQSIQKITRSLTPEELRNIFNEMDSYRIDLDDTDREIPDGLHMCTIKDAVSDIDQSYKLEMKDAIRDMKPADRKVVAKVEQMLEGVMASMKLTEANETKAVNRKALATVEPPTAANLGSLSVQDLLMALATMQNKSGDKGPVPDRCDDCGVRHPVGPDKPCHAKLLAEGKPVPGWDKKPADQKERIESRAADIKRLGPYKDRNKSSGGGSSSKQAALLTLLSSLPGARMAKPADTLLPSAVDRVNATLGSYGGLAPSRVIVDTGNLTGKHLICDRNLFASLDESGTHVPFAVANDEVEYTKGNGTCHMLVIGPDGVPTAKLALDDCAYAPSLGVNLLSVQAAKSRGASFDLDHNIITTSSGTTMPFGDDFTLHIVADTTSSKCVTFTTDVMKRGKDGPTHISTKPLSAKQQKELDLWMARLGYPTVDVLRDLHKVADGTPDIFKKADRHNALSMPRLLADGAKLPTRKLDGPIAKKAGEITSTDHWKASCVGYLGFTGFLGYIDNHSGHFKIYPVVSKSEYPTTTRRYYKDAAHDGVTLAPGSVMYSDNEVVIRSHMMELALDEQGQVHKFSAEYEPWGNGGIESVNRYLPAHMRRCHIDSGAPEELWPFSALDGEITLNITRTRNGTSCRELWCGKRGNVSRRYRLFCKGVCRGPVAWRGGKIAARALDGVYCGKARNKQGCYFLTAEHGLVCSTNYTLFENVFPFKEGFTYRKPATGGHSSGLRVPHVAPPAGGGGGGGGNDDDDSPDDDIGSGYADADEEQADLGPGP